MRILFLIFVFFLNGCSTLYFGGGNTDASKIIIFEPNMHGLNAKLDARIAREVEENCTEISSYHYADGGILASISEFFCIDCKPHSIFSKAVRDSNSHNGNLVVISSWPQHEYWSTNVSSHKCSVEFVENVKLHSKKNNRMAMPSLL